MNKKTVTILIGGIIAGAILGYGMNGPTTEQVNAPNEVVKLAEENKELKDENIELKEKVKIAEPWFELQEKERAEKLAAEKKKEEEKVKKEQEAKKKKVRDELDRTVILLMKENNIW